MASSLIILFLTAVAGLTVPMFCAARPAPRRGSATRVILALVACIFFLAIGAALLMPFAARRQAPGNQSYRVLDDKYEAVLATEWSDRSVGQYANYPSFRSAVSGLLGNAILSARRCGVRGQYVQNLVSTGLRSEWLSPKKIEAIRQTVLSRDGSRWIPAKNAPATVLPKQYLEVAFDVRGNQDKGNIQIKVDVKKNGESVKGNEALPFTILAEYTNQPWVELAGITDQENAAHIIGCSQQFPRLEDALKSALTNARLRCVDSINTAVKASQPDLRTAKVLEIKSVVESYLDDHPELKKDEFVQQTRGHDVRKYRVAVLMDFPRDSILGTLDLSEKPQANSWQEQVIVVIALAILLTLSYLFLDAGRRGRYAWPLRLGTAIVFAGLCVLLWKIGPLM